MGIFIFSLFLKNKKTTLSLLFLVCATSGVCADKKWIPIEPINATRDPIQKQKLDINLSQTQPLSQLVENAKIIQQLIDARGDEEKLGQVGEKNWFPLDGVGGD
jgi:hypothetical protein